MCNTIEDEDHFLLLCADNADLRNKFTPYSFEDYSINYHNLDENGKKQTIVSTNTQTSAYYIKIIEAKQNKMEIKVMDLGKHKKWANHKPLYPGLLNLQRQYMYI